MNRDILKDTQMIANIAAGLPGWDRKDAETFLNALAMYQLNPSVERWNSVDRMYGRMQEKLRQPEE